MKKINIIAFAVLAVFLLIKVQPIKASETDDQQAMDILQNMSKTLAAAEQFSVTVSSSYDAPQENGQMIEFGSMREIQVKRPDKMRVDTQESDGDQRILVFDGKRILVHNITENVYAKADKVGSVDDAVKHLISVLKIPLPLGRMFRTTIPAELERLVKEIDYVELNTLTDVPTDHLAARSRNVDFQIWISQGGKPLPMRIVITYKNYRGDPQFRADFSNWDLSAKGVKGPFAFTPPKDAEQVPMLIRNPAESSIPVPEGGAK